MPALTIRAWLAVAAQAGLIVVLTVPDLLADGSGEPLVGIYLAALGLSVAASLPALAALRWLGGSTIGWRAIGLGLLSGATALAVIHRLPAGAFHELVLGAVRGVGLDQPLVQLFRLSDDSLAAFVATRLSGPILEEAAKGIAIGALLWAHAPAERRLSAGLVIGGAVGLGFAWLETAGAAARIVTDQLGVPWPDQVLIGFVFGGVNGHLVMSALAGAGIAAAARTLQVGTVVAAAGGILAGLLLHVIDSSVGVELRGGFLLVLGESFGPATALPAFGLWLGAALATLVSEGPFLAILGLLVRRARAEPVEPVEPIGPLVPIEPPGPIVPVEPPGPPVEVKPPGPPVAVEPARPPVPAQVPGLPVASEPPGLPVATEPPGLPVASEPPGLPVPSEPPGLPVATEPATDAPATPPGVAPNSPAPPDDAPT